MVGVQPIMWPFGTEHCMKMKKHSSFFQNEEIFIELDELDE